MAVNVSMKQLLESGVHFGHQTRRWDPRMKPYIFTERNGIHIIDLQQTVNKLEEAYNFVRDLVASGGIILFVGTKKQAQQTIEEEVARCGMPYVSQRWLGGMLTNFKTIQGRIRRLDELEAAQEKGDLRVLPKKEAAHLVEQMEKLRRLLGGVREMTSLPDAIFVVDCQVEHMAIAEARRLEIPLVALVDTNCNPDVIDYPVPANDDAIRAVRILTSKIVDAVLEAQELRGAAAEAALAEKAVVTEIEAEEFEAEAEEPVSQEAAAEEPVSQEEDFVPEAEGIPEDETEMTGHDR